MTPNLFIGFGTTETGTLAIAEPSLVRRMAGGGGKPLPGVYAEIIDDTDRPLPAGEVGALRVNSQGMMQSYIGEPAESARAFRDGWFYTGDLAEFTPGGELIHHGRADDMMIADGINIYPAEIEAALVDHPSVAEAAAVLIISDIRGDIPAAAVVTKSPVSEQDLFDYCRSRLGTRAPKRLLILPELPRNAAGKIRRRRC